MRFTRNRALRYKSSGGEIGRGVLATTVRPVGFDVSVAKDRGSLLLRMKLNRRGTSLPIHLTPEQAGNLLSVLAVGLAEMSVSGS